MKPDFIINTSSQYNDHDTTIARLDTAKAFFSKPFKFGGSISYSKTAFYLKKRSAESSIYRDNVHEIGIKQLDGFLISMFFEQKLYKRIYLRHNFIIQFEAIRINYIGRDSVWTYPIEFTNLGYQPEILFQTKGEKVRGYFFAGCGILTSIAPNMRKELFNYGINDFTVQSGLGVTKKFEKVYTGLEFKYLRGLKNLNGDNKNILTEPIEALLRQNCYITLFLAMNL